MRSTRVSKLRVAQFAWIVALGVLGGCGSNVGSQSDSEERIEELSNLAERKCLCRMADRNVAALEREIGRLTSDLKITSMASSSEPLSQELICFPELGEHACVIDQARFVYGEDDFACTAAQATELETIWFRTFSLEDESGSAANAALQSRLSVMRQELRETLTQAECETV